MKPPDWNFWKARAGLPACGTLIIMRCHLGVLIPPTASTAVGGALIDKMRDQMARMTAQGSLPRGGPRIGS